MKALFFQPETILSQFRVRFYPDFMFYLREINNKLLLILKEYRHKRTKIGIFHLEWPCNIPVLVNPALNLIGHGEKLVPWLLPHQL